MPREICRLLNLEITALARLDDSEPQGSSFLYLPGVGIIDHTVIFHFCMGSGDLKSGLYGCAESMLSMKPFP